LTRLAVRIRAVATSGNYRRGFDIGGVHYSHIVDPRSGRPTSQVISATVVAARAADAGALATAFCVLTPEDSERLAAGVPGAEFLIVLANGTHVRSAGWRDLAVDAAPRLRVPSPVASLSAAGNVQAGLPDHELNVNVELAQFQGRADRPYLAIWIEDKDKFPVRTLALWFDKTRWLPELRAWNRDERMRAMAEGNDITASVSSATRPPGKYTLKWDGKDNAGKLVKPGKYTVCIEVTREHGTYQVYRQEMDLTGKANVIQLAPNEEVAAAAIEYAKKGH